MTFYFSLIKRLLLSISLFLFIRIVFVIYNWSLFENAKVSELLKAYLWGIRFDVASAIIVCLPSLLISLLPFTFFFKNLAARIVFLLSHIVAIVFLVVDIEYFVFLGKKMTMDVFDQDADITNQASQLLFYYWHIVVFGIVLIFLVNYFYPKIKEKKGKWPLKTVFSFLFLGLCFVGIRGGLQLRSLSPKDAFIFSDFNLGNVALNPVYTLVRSIGKKGVEKVRYFSSDEEAKEIISEERGVDESLSHPNQNVFVIVLESFSYEYLKQGYMPFLNELALKSLSFQNAFANGRRSIEALPSILASMPSLIDKPIYKSQYQANRTYSLSEALKDNGYKAQFFHGGKKGTMDFDSYVYSIGFDKYFAKEDYPEVKDFDGNWGIYDGPYLKYVVDEVSKIDGPFLAGIFTLSSHQPYSIPSEYQGKFPKGSLEIHESLGYVDQSLKEFFEKASKTSWYENTLFILTADHTQKLETKEFNNNLGHYRVPLVFFHPKINLASYNSQKVVAQTDIFPSVLDFLGVSPKYPLLMGDSVFHASVGEALNKVNNTYFYVYGDHYLRFDGEKSELYQVSKDYTDGPEVFDQKKQALIERRLRALIQYYYNGLRSNTLYPSDN